MPSLQYFSVMVYNILGKKMGYMFDSVGVGKMSLRIDSLFNYDVTVPFLPVKVFVPESTFTAGIYFYKLESETDTITMKMVLLK